MAYRAEPEGPSAPPLVLVHGLGMSSQSFLPVLPYLARDFHVFAPDLPGCGDSDKPAEVFGVPQLVDSLVLWLDAVGLEQAIFVGHSLGGQLVCQLAGTYPERVGRAVLVAPTPDPSSPTAWQKALRLAVDGLYEPTSLIVSATRDYLKANPSRMWRTLKYALRSDVERRAATVQAPTLVIRGERDPVVTGPWVRRLASIIPNASVHEIPDGTHGLPAQSPEPLADLILEFSDLPGVPGIETIEPTQPHRAGIGTWERVL